MSVTISKTNKPLNPRAKDLSPKGYNRASLYSGKALDFDGVNDYVDCGTLDITDYTEISIATYFNTDSTATTQIAFSLEHTTGEDIRFGISAGEIFCAVDDGTLYQITEPVNSDKWYFVVWTFDGSNLKGYINGIEFDSISASFNFSAASGTLNIGRRVGGSLYYNGELANTKIFNTALTAGQVSDLYLNPEKIVPDGVADSALKLWLPMMEGAGTTAYDGSGNGNHGSISGATWTSGVGAPVAQTALVGWNKSTNLQSGSEQIENASYWVLDGVTGTADQTTSPSGSANADLIKETATTAVHWVYSAGMNTTSGLSYTFSTYAKKGTGATAPDILQLSFRSGGHGSTLYANFNLSTGTVTDSSGGTASIVSVGGGWYRLIFTATASATATGNAGGVISFCNNNPTQGRGVSYLGATTSDVFVWGASITQSSSVEPYIPTLATAQTSPVLLPQGLTANKDITNVNSVSRNAYALNLDGASWAEVHDNASLDITSAITLEAWVYNDDSNSLGLLGKWYGSLSKRSYLLYKSNPSVIQLYIADPSQVQKVINASGLSTDAWVHIVGVYDGSTVYLYANGSLSSSSATTISSLYSSDQDLQIGTYSDQTTGYPNQIALPRIYNRAITATEVARNYNADKSKFGL